MEKLIELVEETRKHLQDHKEEWMPKYDTYANAILNGAFHADREKFKQRFPLMIYLPIGEAVKPHPKFSVRYLGNDIGHLKYDGERMVIHFCEAIPELAIAKGSSKWTDVAIKLSKYYEKKITTFNIKHTEHNIESIIISALRGKVRGDKPLSGVQPVLLGGMPMQLLVPLKANTGVPGYIGDKPTQGHIDILLRNSKTRLSVIELKRAGPVSPGQKPIEQSIIYSSYLMYLLRNTYSGDNWWKLFGFAGQIPSTKTGLTINTVCMLSSKNEYFRLLKKYGVTEDNYNNLRAIRVGKTKDKLRLGYLIYTIKDNKTLTIEANI